MRFDVITLFPEVIESYCSVGILGRAFEDNLITLFTHQLRNFGLGKYKKVDDQVYGGGTGMVLKPEPIFAAHRSIPKLSKYKTLLLTPRGPTLKQPFIREKLICEEQLIIICGRYEGFDERVMSLVDYPISLGDYILTGGDVGAMILIDSVSRLLPGVLPKGEEVHGKDSFSDPLGEEIEEPLYTRPPIFEGMQVPEVLMSGNHGEIEKWRKERRKLMQSEEN